MDLALAQARKAAALGEVPVGCVIVRDGAVIGEGYNRRETDRTVLGHAELMAIRQAEQAVGDWRLSDCTLYVTLEPCPMCAGAMIQARIPRVVFGARDEKFGACGSVCDLFGMKFNHHPAMEEGLMAEEAKELMREFFQDLRVTLRTRPKWRSSKPSPAGEGGPGAARDGCGGDT